MADTIVIANPGGGGAGFDVDVTGGTTTPYMKIMLGDSGTREGPVSSAHPLPVNVSTLPAATITGDALTALNTLVSSAAIDNDVFVPDSSRGVKIMGGYQTSPSALANNDVGIISVDQLRRIIPAPGDAQTTQTVTAIQTFELPNPSAGLDVFSTISLTTSPKAIKNSYGKIYDIWFTNSASSTRWLKFYNASAASVSTGTTLPYFTWGLPGTTSNAISGFHGSGFGLQFSTAISVVATASSATSTDTSAPGTNEILLMIGYK